MSTDNETTFVKDERTPVQLRQALRDSEYEQSRLRIRLRKVESDLAVKVKVIDMLTLALEYALITQWEAHNAVEKRMKSIFSQLIDKEEEHGNKH